MKPSCASSTAVAPRSSARARTVWRTWTRCCGFVGPIQRPPKARQHFGRGKLRMAIMRALRDGPKTRPQIVAAIAAEHGMTAKATRLCVYPRLSQMRAEGHVCAPRKDNLGRLLWNLVLGDVEISRFHSAPDSLLD